MEILFGACAINIFGSYECLAIDDTVEMNLRFLN